MDPFSQVYNALWSLAEGSDRLTEMVRLGNRIKFNQTDYSNPLKNEVGEADLPELVLVSTGSSGNIHQTSCSSMFTRTYEWIIATGDASVINVLLPLEFILFAAMTNWQSVLGPLTWQGLSFVKRANLLNINNGLTDSERNRGIVGWSAIWGIEVEMHFETRDLQEYGSIPTTTPAPTTT